MSATSDPAPASTGHDDGTPPRRRLPRLPSSPAAGFLSRPAAVSSRRPGAAVLVIHGFTSSPASMRPWAEALLEDGYTVSLPVLPGHCTSWQDLARTPWTAWRTAVTTAYDELQRNHARVYVCGLSMGGALALDLAARRAPAALALVNPALTFANPTAHVAGALKLAVPSVAAIANDISRQGQDEHAYTRTPVAAVEQLGRIMRQAAASLPGVSAPTIVFRSTTDHVVPDTSIAVLDRRLGTPAGLRRFVSLENSFHVATLDHDADTIFTETLRFFDPATTSGV
ncbi:alpha/beta hydrolase [Zhihengliuella salsuginis]|uniref:Esterase n=1 Tax=Zhihengliuella salsuginis TaxID=578222 RepID=A0ABQ3GIG6_9MICC|nr:alpha/beta fold hydrolase [Zhihengliuella salsuginis]GHD08849.1 esterase [Zhihengliuella salsuginis]